ncbi:MAG: AbrB/MazE/SpoVT family DNA-binding domain-containing protein, partial [Candidatus Thermoplasmatota archaeon]|nr:AbrB/MazE/SpoVT family DNA-binding domain-containing protein [Candidatus Thermoplasmatota archaeon]
MYIEEPEAKKLKGGPGMEIRRVQMTGGSSFIITLPKEWIKSHHINKNDPIGLVYQPDGTLMVTPNITGEQMKREKKIDIDKIDDPEFLFRLLVGAYIMGYSSIELRSKTRFPIEARNTLRRFVQSAIGPEIVEESDKSIQIKDLLNPVEMPFDKSIRRMHTLVRT